MQDFSLKVKLNENNIQAPFQYKPAENEFILNEISEDILLDSENVRVKNIEGQKLFCVDLGYSVDGEIYDMYFAIDKIKIYPTLLNSIKELKSVEVRDNAIYFVDDTNFKSIAFLTKANFNKTLSFTIFTYASVFSSFMFDEIAKKINALDTDFPIQNFYQNTKYKINDIIKKDGYLYRVVADFTSSNSLTNSIIITPFKRVEESELNMYDLVQDNNQFFIVNSKNQELKPLTSIILWEDSINKIYKNTIIIKNENNKLKKYLVLNDILNPIWYDLINNNDIIELYTSDDIVYNNNDAETIKDGLDLAFTKIDTVNQTINSLDKNIETKLDTKQNNLFAGENINIDDSMISVIVNNRYDLNYNYYLFPIPYLSFTIPDEILLKLSVEDSYFEATIKKENNQYVFNSTITLTEETNTITLKIKDIDLIDIAQFFTPSVEYQLENCILTLNRDMTFTIKQATDETNFEASELKLSYTFTDIYNKNIYFLTNYGYLTLQQDEKNGIPRGSVVSFAKDFTISQDMIKKYEETIITETEQSENNTQIKNIDYIELEIYNEIIKEYFETINDFNQMKTTNDIYFLRTTQDEDNEIAEPIKTIASYGFFNEDGKYKLRITRSDKLELLENDIIFMSFPPEKNKELPFKSVIANNLDETIQALTENDKATITALTMQAQVLSEKINNETTERQNTDSDLLEKIEALQVSNNNLIKQNEQLLERITKLENKNSEKKNGE